MKKFRKVPATKFRVQSGAGAGLSQRDAETPLEEGALPEEEALHEETLASAPESAQPALSEETAILAADETISGSRPLSR